MTKVYQAGAPDFCPECYNNMHEADWTLGECLSCGWQIGTEPKEWGDDWDDWDVEND